MKRLISMLLLLTFLLTPVLLSSCTTEKIIYVTESKEDDEDDHDDESSAVNGNEQSSTSMPEDSSPEGEDPEESDPAGEEQGGFDSETEEEEKVKAHCGMYCQEGTIYAVNFETGKTTVITDDLGAWKTENFQRQVIITPDGQYALFPAALKEGDKSYTLLIQDLSDDSERSAKVADSITSYFVADDSETVIYLTKSGALCLYRISTGKAETIGTKVNYFESAENGRNLVFCVKASGGERYYRILNGKYEQPVLLPEGFYANMSKTEGSLDYSVLYYKEADVLYCIDASYTEGAGIRIGTKIAKTFEMEDGTLYYTKKSGAENVQKYFVNDMGAIGEGLLEKMKNLTDSDVYELYFYDGESHLLAENVVSEYGGYIDGYDAKQKTVIYCAYSSLLQIKLSEFVEDRGSLEDAYSYLEDYSSTYAGYWDVSRMDAAYFMAVGTECVSLAECGLHAIASGYLYGIDNYDQEIGSRDVYVALIDGATVGKPVLLCEGAKAFSEEDGKLYFVKEDKLFVYDQGEINQLHSGVEDLLWKWDAVVFTGYSVADGDAEYHYRDGFVIGFDNLSNGFYLEANGDDYDGLGTEIQWVVMPNVGGWAWDVLSDEEY